MHNVILRSEQKDTQQQPELIRDVILPKNRLRSSAKKQVIITDVYSRDS